MIDEKAFSIACNNDMQDCPNNWDDLDIYRRKFVQAYEAAKVPDQPLREEKPSGLAGGCNSRLSSQQPVGLSQAHALDIINKHLLNTSVTKSDRWNKVARDIVCDLAEAGCPLTVSVDLPVYEVPKRESVDEGALQVAIDSIKGMHWDVVMVRDIVEAYLSALPKAGQYSA